MTRGRRAAGATALAVALGACTSTAVPEGEATRVLGVSLHLPAGFAAEDAGDVERPRDTEVFFVGPRGGDGTAVGITVERLCEGPLPTWDQVRTEVEAGRHTAWDDYDLTAPPVEVDVDGADRALRVRGTYSLRREDDGQRVELVHDELILHDPDVVHRVRIEGSADDVADVPVDDLFASVEVVSTACLV